jgi:phosphomannomutase
MKVDELKTLVRQWIDGDPDPSTRDELEQLVAAEAWEDLSERFDGGLTFGTAGLRGVDGGGPNRMNLAVVTRATYGLAQHLKRAEVVGPIVVGRDARTRSKDYYDATVGVLLAQEFEVLGFEDPVPTPLVAYAAGEFAAGAAIVITASHNPPEYNGYKVYNEHGSQIVPPTDQLIATAIDLAPPALMIPVSTDAPVPVSSDVADRYLAAVSVEAPTPMRIAYTALHGVGGAMTRAALAASGHEVFVAEDQFQPDPEFPSVRFPNPEEPGSMDQVMALGQSMATDLVFANDPDADRLAAGSPDRGLLSGNDLGVLIFDGVLSSWDAPDRPLAASTVVSTPMARLVAEARGARYEETLTGFKWIWMAMRQLEEEGAGRFAAGFEEALGYSVFGSVRDKDGISAAVMVANLAASLAERGMTLWDRLAELHEEFGAWRSTQRSIVRTGSDGKQQLIKAVQAIAAEPPHDLAGRDVLSLTDYRTGEEDRAPWLPNANMVVLGLEGARVVVRPSGTEPKLKVYVDLASDVEGDLDALADAAVAGLQI